MKSPRRKRAAVPKPLPPVFNEPAVHVEVEPGRARIEFDPPLFTIVNRGVRSCPDCEQGKHVNCTGASWDYAADAETTCPCSVLLGHGAQR